MEYNWKNLIKAQTGRIVIGATEIVKTSVRFDGDVAIIETKREPLKFVRFPDDLTKTKKKG